MNKIYLVISLTFLSLTSFSQNDIAATKILNAVSAKMKNSSGVKTSFSMVAKNRMGKINSTVNGKMLVKGIKYYIMQGSMEIFNDGKKNWSYNGGDEVTVTDAEGDDQPLNPQRLISGQFDQDFIYKLIPSKGLYHQIQLTPKEKRKNFQEINLFVDKTKSIVAKAMVLDKNSNTYNITFNRTSTNATIADSSFVFDKKRYNKNIEVIE